MVTVKRLEDSSAAAPAPAPVELEGVESLESIAQRAEAQARAETAAAAPAQAAQQQAQAEAHQAEVHAVLGEVTGMLTAIRDLAADLSHEAGALPREKVLQIWSDETIGKLAGPLLVLADRHGGQLGPFLEKHGPYMALIGAGVLPAIATFKAVRDHQAINVQAHEVTAGG